MPNVEKRSHWEEKNVEKRSHWEAKNAEKRRYWEAKKASECSVPVEGMESMVGMQKCELLVLGFLLHDGELELGAGFLHVSPTPSTEVGTPPQQV